MLVSEISTQAPASDMSRVGPAAVSKWVSV